MPILTSRQNILSGVPHGGIGNGKIEVLTSGVLNAFTFLNNWGTPLSGTADAPGILGHHLGVRVSPISGESAPESFLLQTAPLRRIPRVRSIRYTGHFPSAKLQYEHPSLPAEVTLETFSPWIPGDVKNSSLPAVYFRLSARNAGPQPISLALFFMGRNLCGDWCVGRRNRISEDRESLSLLFSNPSSARLELKRGQMLWNFRKDGWKLSFMESWNAVSKNFKFGPGDIALTAWDIFAETGRLPDLRSGGAAAGENREFCGAVSAQTRLAPGQKKDWLFSLAWQFPGESDGGHRRWFSGVSEASGYASRRRDVLEKRTKKFQKAVFSLPFPEWFNDALLTNLAPFFSATRHLKNGRFAFYEAPAICPLMGTVDVGFYGSIPLSYFFPELEISQHMQFARAQSPEGYVPHDLGRGRLDCPSSGTTNLEWKDLNPKFVLMAWRDFLWSGDAAFLKKIYPAAKKAIVWSLKQDADGNGLPDHEGQDQTFDLWDMQGTHPYTSGLLLAALLAAQKMASRFRDARFEALCREAFLKGSASFEKELWNGRFYGKDYCALSQLNGQWYADLLGLGSIADDRRIRKALHSILISNSRHSRFGLVNSVLPDGRLDVSNDHARNVWAGMNYAFLSLALMRGFPLENLLEHAQRIWNNTVTRQKNPWNQPDTVDSKSGRYVFGDAYYRNMAIWSIPIAYSKKDRKTAGILARLRSVR